MGATDYELQFPFGEADSQALVAAATVEAEIVNANTLITFTVALAADMTLNLASFNTELKVGSYLTVTALSNGTGRDITLGTGFLGTVITGVSNKTITSAFQYNGTAFVHLSTQQID